MLSVIKPMSSNQPTIVIAGDKAGIKRLIDALEGSLKEKTKSFPNFEVNSTGTYFDLKVIVNPEEK